MIVKFKRAVNEYELRMVVELLIRQFSDDVLPDGVYILEEKDRKIKVGVCEDEMVIFRRCK